MAPGNAPTSVHIGVRRLSEYTETSSKRVSARQGGSQPVAPRQPGKYIPQGITAFRKPEHGWARCDQQRSVGEMCASFAHRTVARSPDSVHLPRSQPELSRGACVQGAHMESARVVHHCRRQKRPPLPSKSRNLFPASLGSSSIQDVGPHEVAGLHDRQSISHKKRFTGHRQTTSTLYEPVRGASVGCKSNCINSLSGVLRADNSLVVRIAAANRYTIGTQVHISAPAHCGSSTPEITECFGVER